MTAVTTGWQRILDEIAAGTSSPPPHVGSLSLEVVSLEWRDRFVAVEFDIPARFCVVDDTVFGGYIAGVHDEAAGFAMYTVLPDDRYLATKQLHVDYWRRPGRPGPGAGRGRVGGGPPGGGPGPGRAGGHGDQRVGGPGDDVPGDPAGA